VRADTIWNKTEKADVRADTIWNKTEKADVRADTIWNKTEKADVRADTIWNKTEKADVRADTIWNKTEKAGGGDDTAVKAVKECLKGVVKSKNNAHQQVAGTSTASTSSEYYIFNGHRYESKAEYEHVKKVTEDSKITCAPDFNVYHLSECSLT
jgi:hypothetical protein